MTFGLRLVSLAVALIKWAGGCECKCPLRVNRQSASAGSNYHASDASKGYHDYQKPEYIIQDEAIMRSKANKRLLISELSLSLI